MTKKFTLFFTYLLSIFIVVSLVEAGFIGRSAALQLQSRSLAILSSIPSATTTDTFSFTFPDNSVVGSIEFRYCESSLPEIPCVAPPGLNASGAVLQQPEIGETGFTIASTSANQILITRIPTATSSEMAQYTFSNIVNPNFTGSFFGIITTYPTVDGSGAYTDYGGVVSSTATTVGINSYVPPILDFCVGQTVASNCSSTSGDFIDFGNFSPSSTTSASSQMAVATNAQSGVSITTAGATLTSGNNVIVAPSSPTASQVGVDQFGINLRGNSSPSVGADPSGPGVITPTAQYDIPNEYDYSDGSQAAYATTATDFRTLTVSYIVNVSSSQSPGVYNTNVTFICTGSF